MVRHERTMRDPYWATPKSQVLLPTTPESALLPDNRTGWHGMTALASCGLIFAIDVIVPGVLVGLLYSVVVVGVVRSGHVIWPALVCALGTVFHAIAGFYDLKVIDLGSSIANRGLAILALWSVGGWIAYQMATRQARQSGAWTPVTID